MCLVNTPTYVFRTLPKNATRTGTLLDSHAAYRVPRTGPGRILRTRYFSQRVSCGQVESSPRLVSDAFHHSKTFSTLAIPGPTTPDHLPLTYLTPINHTDKIRPRNMLPLLYSSKSRKLGGSFTYTFTR